ncbi:MAG: Fe-S cluster assembly protein SufD [Tepidisphaeraceae bacterium]
MTQVAEEKLTYMSNFSRIEKQIGPGAPAWLERMRKSAIEKFEKTGFPTTDMEEWRFTNVAPIARIPFKPARQVELHADDIAAFSFGHDAAVEIVFVNGHFSPKLSVARDLPQGVTVSSLATALLLHSELIEEHLSRHAEISANPFVALNTGFVRDGAFVHLSRNAVLEKPIHVMFVSVAGKEPMVAHPRVLVVADDNSQATIVKSFVSTAAGVYFDNAVTEIVVGHNARIDHNKLQQDSPDAFHVSTMQVRLARSSRFISHAATIGGKLTRNDLNVVLAGEGADATLNGLVIIGGDQHCDNHTLLDHAAPNCPSHELYKHVLNGKSSGVFKGKILVRKIAQKTDSKQTSKSLLLSDDAVMNSQPALEIYADDVKCTHGSTTGPVDEEQVFYMRSRGVSLDAARHLMTYAFAADVTRRIKVEPVRRRVESIMAAQHGLPQDLRITDLGEHDEAAR